MFRLINELDICKDNLLKHNIMTEKTKKIIFWAVVAAVVLGLALYLLFAKPGNVFMASVFGVTGLVAGWFARVFYDTKIK